jgi:hypothetical protein
MWHASIIDSYLIDFYVPFLPLERLHVKNCIKIELLKYNFEDKQKYVKENLENDLDQIADEMVYEPPGLNKFSTAGCKRVPNLVRNLIVERKYKLKEKDEL